MKRYKYKLFKLNNLIKELNELGKEGWELVDIEFISETNTHNVLMKQTYYDE
jgi:hypothetical protein